jgi:hypothetical protein
MNKRQRKKITKKQVREARTLGQAREMGIGGQAAKYATPNPRDEELRKIGYDDARAGKEARSFATMYDIGYKEGLKSKKEKPMSKYDFFKENKMNIKKIIKEELQNFLNETEASKCKQMLDNGEISPDQYKACVDQYEKDYGEVEDTGARPIGESKMNIKKIINEEVRKYLNEAKVRKDFGQKFPLKLSDVTPKVAQVVATSGLKDKKEEDDKISVDAKPEGVASVTDLKPSQSSMNIEKGLAFVIQMLHPKGKLDAGGNLGAFITKDKYIMDGHHRWIATAMVDPSLSVGGYEVEFPAQQLIAILNAMTKGRYGVEKGKDAKGGFEQFKTEPIKKQLIQYWKNGVWDNLKADDVQAVIQQWTGKKGEEAIDAAVAKMVNNLSGITMSVPSWAPERPDMPVIDKPNVDDAVKALETGEIDWAQPPAG